MQKIVWDMDPGIDDALALILALKSAEVKVLGITTVAGNGPLPMTSANARRVLEYLNVESILVAVGAANPLNHPLEDALSYHGPDGLGNCGLPPPKLPVYPGKAWDFITRLVSDAPGEVALVATGPLTNVAYAFKHHPELSGLLAKVILMGGAYRLTPYGEGNRTLYAEFNIWQDPEAAYIVFNSGVDIFAVGLDVTMDPAVCLNSQHLEQIRTGQTPAAHLTAQLVEYEVKNHGCCRMHDPLALAMLLDASLLGFTLARVEVVKGNDWDRGITRILPSDSCQMLAKRVRLIHVASVVDGPRFVKLFLSRVLEQ
jgi:inosine-uridine nucleoside N-ribohydrolase